MSGSKVPYHLRVNKYVDRQLFIETLDYVARYQPLKDAAYLSMGGGYLEDFRVLHQAFAIRRMLSFDLEDWMITRQEVNRPYGFIECQHASSTAVVRDFDAIRTRLTGPDGRVIIWLDYTEESMRWDQLNDLEQLTKKLIHGDVFRITMNAHRLNFGTQEKYQLARQVNKTDQPTLGDWWNMQLIEQLKDYMPTDRREPDCIGSDYEFAVTLARAVKLAAQEGIKSRPTLLIEPLLSVVYADGQQMITITGMVLEADQRDEFRERSRWAEWQFAPGEEWDRFTCLAVPHLSVRERSLIHDLMPTGVAPDYVSQLDFRLDAESGRHAQMIDQYITHYRRYPTFAPTDII
jgi:hypothetical protein